jgi:hypothetical protein
MQIPYKVYASSFITDQFPSVWYNHHYFLINFRSSGEYSSGNNNDERCLIKKRFDTTENNNLFSNTAKVCMRKENFVINKIIRTQTFLCNQLTDTQR